MPKQRLDILLVERGLVKNRSQAQRDIEAGLVSSGGVRLEKPSHQIDDEAELSIEKTEEKWVSRGGQKLAHALSHFSIDPKNMIALDIGASTGGFTDVLLQAGAIKVYAVDVGHGQMDPSLLDDERVVVMEKTNARYLTQEEIPDALDIIVCDASFISLTLVLPASLTLAKPGAYLVALIKPQFEVGKGNVGKGGVVSNKAQHKEVCTRIEQWLAEQEGWQVLGITESPLLGPKGNKEFLLAGRRGNG